MNLHFSSRVTNFEFVKSVRESGFSFKSHKEKIDLSKIAHLDLDRVARDLDISLLQEHVGTLVNCDLGELKGIDPGLVKLFHLAQLCMEYCLYCQDFLSTCLNSLESVHVETLKELETTKEGNKTLKDKLKKENRKSRHLIEKKENGQTPYFECNQCEKRFSSQEFLENHIQRRHDSEMGGSEQYKELLQDLKKEFETFRQEYQSEKKVDYSAENKQEAQIKREQALWEEIEKSQAEQRARHQAEIADLTANFQIQLKQSLADLASNLSNANILNSTEKPLTQPGEDSLAPKIGNMEQMLSEINDMWKNKFAEQESWFKSENAKLVDQLQKMQEREDLRWHQLQDMPMSKAPEDANIKIPSFSAPPVPAARRRRTVRQPLSTTLGSKLEIAKGETPKQSARDEMVDFAQSTDESESINQAPQNFIVCVPKVIPSRPKSALSSAPIQPLESTSDGEETSEISEDIDATLNKMKDAIEHNPAMMVSLKNEVENQIEEKMQSIGLSYKERLTKKEYNAVNTQIDGQRKSLVSQFPGFWKLRKSLEKKVEKKAKEVQSEIVVEPNVMPSKIKQNPGFFSKLTKHYGKKDKRSKSETQIFTSTPLKSSGDEASTHSILKGSKGSFQGSKQDIAAKENFSEEQRELTRAQSLPGNKFVSFVASDNENDKENSWDESSSKVAEPKHGDKGTSSLLKDKKNPFVTSTTADLHKFGAPDNMIDLEKELAALQFSNPGSAFQSKPSKTTKADLSLNLSDDNSWDLEDI